VSQVELQDVSKTFNRHVAVDGINLTIPEGEFLTLLGASGSGKTTCLRMIAGFVKPDSGRLLLGGQEATNVPAHKRNMGIVFQNYALFPHLTVAENVAFGLKARRLPKAEVAQRTAEALKLVHLEALSSRYPKQTSGGQRQRVALARAIAIRPSVLLLDEPLSALDLKLRSELQHEIRRIQQLLKITTLFVTHDQGEAFGMSDRVAVMHNGRIAQLDTPANIYRRPTSRFVADFVGTSNFLDVIVERHLGEGRYRVALAASPSKSFAVISAEAILPPAARAVVSVRPEHARMTDSGDSTLTATVHKSTYTGERWIVECIHDGGFFTVSLPGWDEAPAMGTPIGLSWSPEHGVLLKAENDAAA
jgi:ABC-type Fe3+/spermidine/putrescine transport system ATPase subunit